MKLIELELTEGLSRRQGIFDKLGTILKQDWGSLEEIQQQQAALQKRNDRDIHQEEITRWKLNFRFYNAELSMPANPLYWSAKNDVLIKQLSRLHSLRVFNGTHTIDLPGKATTK